MQATKELRSMPCQHLNAGHDINGNPQRLYVCYGDNYERLAIINEGYKGEILAQKVSKDKGFNGYVYIFESLDITKRQYSSLIKIGKTLDIYLEG